MSCYLQTIHIELGTAVVLVREPLFLLSVCSFAGWEHHSRSVKSHLKLHKSSNITVADLGGALGASAPPAESMVKKS